MADTTLAQEMSLANIKKHKKRHLPPTKIKKYLAVSGFFAIFASDLFNYLIMAREDIVGRKREIALLDSYMATSRPEFIALYGRRRIGKTFLVKKLYEESFCFYSLYI